MVKVGDKWALAYRDKRDISLGVTRDSHGKGRDSGDPIKGSPNGVTALPSNKDELHVSVVTS